MTDINRKFCKLAFPGKDCTYCLDYSSSPVEVLRVMMAREDKEDFCTNLGMYNQDGFEYGEASKWIEYYILDESRPCKLIMLANEWMEGMK